MEKAREDLVIEQFQIKSRLGSKTTQRDPDVADDSVHQRLTVEK